MQTEKVGFVGLVLSTHKNTTLDKIEASCSGRKLSYRKISDCYNVMVDIGACRVNFMAVCLMSETCFIRHIRQFVRFILNKMTRDDFKT